MLANADGNVGVFILSLSPEFFDGVLLQNAVAGAGVTERVGGFPLRDLLVPFCEVGNVFVCECSVESRESP